MATTAAEAAERADKAALPEGFHADSEIKQVSIDALNVDRSYQRDLSMTLVEQIRNNWDEVASELILVSRRPDGTLWLINGQHRTAAARMLGHKKIWARIVKGLEAPQEAALRLKTNVRMTDRPLERFRAQLVSGDPDSKAIVKILKRFDTEVNEVPSVDSGINAISTVESLYRLDEGYTLTHTLEYIKSVYGFVGGKYSTASILRGVAWFLSKHDQEVDHDRMRELLKGFGLAALDRRARVLGAEMGGSLWLNYYRAFVSIYNEKLPDKSKLQWQLRGAASMGRDSGVSWGRGTK